MWVRPAWGLALDSMAGIKNNSPHSIANVNGSSWSDFPGLHLRNSPVSLGPARQPVNWTCALRKIRVHTDFFAFIQRCEVVVRNS